MKKGLCIYHANCNDGFAAALAVWMKYGDEWDYFPMQHGDAIEDPYDLTITKDSDDPLRPELYENIMLVDFSLPRDYMIELSKLTNLLVIDHHKTAMEACEGLDFCKFDLSKSGCEAAWKYLFPQECVPAMFRWIGDRDLWKFEYPETKDFCAGLAFYEKSFNIWENCMMHPESVIKDGKAILQLQEKQTKDFVQQWRDNIRYADIPNVKNRMMGYTVPIANCTDLISERIGALSEGFPFAIGYFDTRNKRVFSLRTRLKTVDCGSIANQFGGGGHPGAAGFSVDLSKVDPTMSAEFFESIIING